MKQLNVRQFLRAHFELSCASKFLSDFRLVPHTEEWHDGHSRCTA